MLNQHDNGYYVCFVQVRWYTLAYFLYCNTWDSHSSNPIRQCVPSGGKGQGGHHLAAWGI